jgi:hypothetical protein
MEIPTWAPKLTIRLPMQVKAALQELSRNTSINGFTYILVKSLSTDLKSPTTFTNSCNESNNDLVSPRVYSTIRHLEVRLRKARPGGG